MAEGFELVRTVRQHIRRSAMLLDQGKFDEALSEANSALALDPQSLSAQAMHDRIGTAKAGTAAPDRRSQPEQTSSSFVPHGVSAASWRGFEQRIAERRLKALLDTINASIVAGDGAAARMALEEARELSPDAAVLARYEARVAAVPQTPPVATAKSGSRIWMRAMGAAALFLVGVSLLLGIEWMRPADTATSAPPAPVVTPSVPAVAPTQDVRPAPSPNLGPVPVAINNEEESVPAIVGPPEPLLRPTATTGGPLPPLTARSVSMAAAQPSAIERGNVRVSSEDEEPSAAPRGETSDEFVAASRNAAVTPDAGAAVASAAMPSSDTPVNADARPVPPSVAPAAATASAITIPSGAEQTNRVEEVLRRYARAYAQLDAGAARAVWPTVDERALARAFQNLSSQKVSFDDCEIDIRGAVANASCRGQASYAPKVGNREPRTESRNWRFELRRDGDAWQIVDVDARRQSTLEYR